jgi:hypothetical protein
MKEHRRTAVWKKQSENEFRDEIADEVTSGFISSD